MKRLIAVGCTAALGLVLGSPPLALAQSGQFDRFYCQLDLASANITTPTGVDALQTTTDSKKVCSSGGPENIVLECRKLIDGWTGGTVRKRGIPCQVNGKQCGLDGFLDVPFTSSLQISSTGRALLRCHFRPR